MRALNLEPVEEESSAMQEFSEKAGERDEVIEKPRFIDEEMVSILFVVFTLNY